MKYNDYLLKVLKSECPFCDMNKDYVLEKGKYFNVILARAPYVKDHVIIVPKRHFVRLGEMTSEEGKSLIIMIDKWTKKLEKIHKEVNILLRDGVANGIIGKSIDHLHLHLIPDHQVHSSSGPGRKVFSDYQLIKKTKEFKDKIKGK